MLTLFLAAALATAPPVAPTSPSPDVARIQRSPSTNEAGITILVNRSGALTLQANTTAQSLSADKALATQLYADIDRAKDLSTLPSGQCMKSASFGTTTSIAYNGRRSPDLECAQNALEQALRSDVDEIIRAVTKGQPTFRRTLPVMTAPAPR
jgi:hypothetical protein